MQAPWPPCYAGTLVAVLPANRRGGNAYPAPRWKVAAGSQITPAHTWSAEGGGPPVHKQDRLQVRRQPTERRLQRSHEVNV